MANHLLLCIAPDFVRASLVEPVRGNGLVAAWKQFRHFLWGRTDAQFRTITSHTVTGSVDANSLVLLAEKAIKQLESSALQNSKGKKLMVEVSAVFARLGFLELDETISTSDAIDDFAAAWVQHSWGIQPSAIDMRCTPLPNTLRWIVVGIDKFITQQLNLLCQSHGMHLTDCKPALATQWLHLAPRNNMPAIDVVSEYNAQGELTPLVQLLARQGATPLSVSRMWLGNVDAAQRKAAIDSLVERVATQHRIKAPFTVQRWTWPGDRA